ncbi:hypothetical protein B0F90DRAFT_1817641 [Multifurca ochricompacta]|uniref:Uncharacterized protein n=1 Tax=Multifurca ochricompacta TaxID=376703 RepID=A0AAD4QNB7_9AGAM|nr:hypothetical protein B0F90DRAFT_1817641 [Multifurca ochricompacta]
MAFRQPAHLESFIPPPAEQVQQRRPWQGTLTLTFLNANPGAFQDVYVTAAETDGDSRMELWPRRLYVYLGARRVPHNDIKSWVKRYTPPICALMPDKLPDPAANTLNQANFANLSRMLLDNQIVAMAPWNQDNLPGAGIMIYPTSSTVSLLVGAIFLSGPFPEFAVYQQSGRANPPNAALAQTSHHQFSYGGQHSSGRFAAP